MKTFWLWNRKMGRYGGEITVGRLSVGFDKGLAAGFEENIRFTFFWGDWGRVFFPGRLLIIEGEKGD